MKYNFYMQHTCDINQSVILEKKLNEYKGIKATVDGGFGIIAINYQKRNASRQQINKLINQMGISHKKLRDNNLLEPSRLDLKIVDVALKDNVDLGMFISYAASLVNKTNLNVKFPVLALIKDNNIKLKRVKNIEEFPGKYIKGQIKKQKILFGTNMYINGGDNIQQYPRLYLSVNDHTLGYIEFSLVT